MKTIGDILLVAIYIYLAFMLIYNVCCFIRKRGEEKQEYGLYIYVPSLVDIRILDLTHKKVLSVLMDNFYKWDKEIVVHDSTNPEFTILERKEGVSYKSDEANSIENYLSHHLKLGTRIHVRDKKTERFTLQVYKLNR